VSRRRHPIDVVRDTLRDYYADPVRPFFARALAAMRRDARVASRFIVRWVPPVMLALTLVHAAWFSATDRPALALDAFGYAVTWGALTLAGSVMRDRDRWKAAHADIQGDLRRHQRKVEQLREVVIEQEARYMAVRTTMTQDEARQVVVDAIASGSLRAAWVDLLATEGIRQRIGLQENMRAFVRAMRGEGRHRD